MGRKTVLKNFRIIDEGVNILGSVIAEDGIIRDVIPGPGGYSEDSGDLLSDRRIVRHIQNADMVIDGGEGTDKWGLTLLPALVDLHAHFRDPGFPEKETLESASLAAAAGGYGTVVCMANTHPVLDTREAVISLRARADALDLIDLFPAMALSRGMEGKELSGIVKLPVAGAGGVVRILSEDGKDLANSALFTAALEEARRAGVVVSVHAELGSIESQAARKSGKARAVWSRMEEINGVRRAIELGKKTGCHIHIAHVSTLEAAEMIRAAKAERGGAAGGFVLSAEVTPHHLFLSEEDAAELGSETHGLVNPPLRSALDRQALIAAVLDGTIDAIATDHAPHTRSDKEGGAAGFTGFETAFSICLTELVREDRLSLPRLASLMSGAPARILGLADRGRIVPGCRADFFVVDASANWTVDPALFRSRGKNSPCTGRELRGRVLMTIRQGRPVFVSPGF
ncbi:MAG: dihydroorotase [Spirochaetaceae bacterium]|jgi:dihydroorotase|nr:dihydroorotase [Spirochaetaceae bacterium]